MKKRFLALLTAALLAAAVLCFAVSAFDANDYDYGGGGGGFSFSSGDDLDSGGDLTSLILAVIVVAIMCVYWAIKDKIEKHRNKNKPKTPAAPPVAPQPKVIPAAGGEGMSVPIPNRTADIRDILKQSEPDFSEQEFIGSAVKLFADIRGAVCARNVETLRPAVRSELFGALYDTVRGLSDRHVTEHCERLAVTNAYITSLVRDGSGEYLTVYIGAQYVSYLTDDSTGSVVDGSTETVFSYRWLMTFFRAAAASGACPHCGAPIPAGSAVCEYCGCAAASGNADWLLCGLDTVTDDTTDLGIKI